MKNRKSRNNSDNSVPWFNPSMRNNNNQQFQNQRNNLRNNQQSHSRRFNNLRQQVNQPPTPMQPPIVASALNITIIRNLVIQKINALRIQQGFPEVVVDPTSTLMRLAQEKAEDMPGWYPEAPGHVSPNLGSPLDQAREAAIEATGNADVYFPYELLAETPTPLITTNDQVAQSAINTWLRSPFGHRFHLLWTPELDQCDFIINNPSLFDLPPNFQCPPVVESPERYTHIGVGYSFRANPEFPGFYQHFFSLWFNDRSVPLYGSTEDDPYRG